MEAGPHPIVEAFIERLLPPACREHVIGDLHERYVSASQYVERRRDEQYQWPARRRPLMIGIVVAFAFLFGATRLFVLSPNGRQVPLTNAVAWPAVVAALVLGLYLFTRRFTNRAAAAFQREIDTLDSSRSGPGQE